MRPSPRDVASAARAIAAACRRSYHNQIASNPEAVEFITEVIRLNDEEGAGISLRVVAAKLKEEYGIAISQQSIRQYVVTHMGRQSWQVR